MKITATKTVRTMDGVIEAGEVGEVYDPRFPPNGGACNVMFRAGNGKLMRIALLCSDEYTVSE
jgi:hypothetical protein